jgi:hypothetical protein
VQAVAFCGKEVGVTLRWWICLLFLALLTQCETGIEKEREIGFIGKARANPFLAFERFVEKRRGHPLAIQTTWPELDHSQSMIFFTADQLSTRLGLEQVGDWTQNGGHAVILLDRADLHLNDWSTWFVSPDLPEALMEWSKKRGVELKTESSDLSYAKAKFRGRSYDVEMGAKVKLLDEKGRDHPVISRAVGDGSVTWIADASILRNRWIDQKQHIDLINDLLDLCSEGNILFLQGVGISFWELLWQKGWMVLLAVAVVIATWLITHLPRFGPMQSALKEDDIRAYDHHLEMIGDFHWRLDRGVTLLAPLREEAQELCHHWQMRNGRLDETLFDVMSARTQLPVERIERAMTDSRARDQLIFSRIVADLQSIRKAFT